MNQLIITDTEAKTILEDFYQKNHNSILLSKEEIIERSKLPHQTPSMTWFGFTKDHIPKINPYKVIIKLSEDKVNEIIFGFRNGLFFSKSHFYFVCYELSSKQINVELSKSIPLEEFANIQMVKHNKKDEIYYKIGLDGFNINLKRGEKTLFQIGTCKYTSDEIQIIEKLKIVIKTFIDEKSNYELEQKLLKEKLILSKLHKSIDEIYSDLDKNNDGRVDLVDNELNKLLSKNQKEIIDFDKNYIHQFIKISNYIKTKNQNTQRIFENIKETKNQNELNNQIQLLKNQIHSYNLLVFHSINMISALLIQDLITFYEIYESFDKLGIFNSNWENEVSDKLTNIGEKLDDLMYSIHNMEQNIVSELRHLSYVTQDSFEDLNNSVVSQLKEVESSINTNNLLNAIQTYQLYKINSNTKRLS
jgi:hypothetical protein